MNPIQEAKQELEASIRYAENAIVKANQTIESMGAYQEQTGREEALERELEQRISEVADLKAQIEGHRTNMALMTDELEELRGIIDRMGDDSKGDSVTIKLLEERIADMSSDMVADANTIKKLRDEKEASSGPCGCQAYRDLEEARGRAEGEVELLQGAIKELESKVQGQYDDIVQLERDVEFYTKKYNELELSQGKGVPTMPVIPKAVAIAIFREGVQHGVEAACRELEGQTIYVEESEYVGGFEVSFTKEIDLDDELDLDWMRGKLGRYDEGFVTDALSNLCADKEFECRIHGVDDQKEKKND